MTDVYNTNCRAKEAGLSFAQMSAIDWMSAQKAPIFRRDYRRANITTGTMASLFSRGLIDTGHDTAGPYWFVTNAGRAAAEIGRTMP